MIECMAPNGLLVEPNGRAALVDQRIGAVETPEGRAERCKLHIYFSYVIWWISSRPSTDVYFFDSPFFPSLPRFFLEATWQEKSKKLPLRKPIVSRV